jgi:hypothetical protein
MGTAGYVDIMWEDSRLRRMLQALLAAAVTRGFLGPAVFTGFCFLFLETNFWLLRGADLYAVGILIDYWLIGTEGCYADGGWVMMLVVVRPAPALFTGRREKLGDRWP